MNKEVLIIGPEGVGKSTIGKQLADILKYQQRSLDSVQQQYFTEMGYDKNYAAKLRTTNMDEFRLYREKFYSYALEKELSQFRGKYVFDFGAPQSVYSESNLKHVKELLLPYPWVILLLPSPDDNQSIQELLKRKQIEYEGMGQTLNNEDFIERNKRYFTNPSNKTLAKHTIYTNGRSSEEICSDILRLGIDK